WMGCAGCILNSKKKHFFFSSTNEKKKPRLNPTPTATPGSLPSELSMPFGLKGFSHLVSTGCTSSTDAIAYAAQDIVMGRINIVLTGGVDAPLAHSIVLGFCVMKVLTPSWNHDPQRASRPFSRDRDGFVLGEGAYFFVLEQMDHA